jgi:hypothetical protein
MEHRKHKRLPVTLSAEIVSDGKNYEGIIGNVSERGLAYTMTTFVKTTEDFVPKGMMETIVRIPTGDKLCLSCEVRWFLSPSPDRSSIIIGMKIVDPPREYIEWVNEFEASEEFVGNNITD